jgi:hypothetical protein
LVLDRIVFILSLIPVSVFFLLVRKSIVSYLDLKMKKKKLYLFFSFFLQYGPILSLIFPFCFLFFHLFILFFFPIHLINNFCLLSFIVLQVDRLIFITTSSAKVKIELDWLERIQFWSSVCFVRSLSTARIVSLNFLSSWGMEVSYLAFLFQIGQVVWFDWIFKELLPLVLSVAWETEERDLSHCWTKGWHNGS